MPDFELRTLAWEESVLEQPNAWTTIGGPARYMWVTKTQLQYRHKIEYSDYSAHDAYGGPLKSTKWSDWKDVPTIKLSEKSIDK